MPDCIQIKELTKCYGNAVAVGGLSLEIETGEVFGLLGPNGAGKSTTLHMLNGLVRPTQGSISIFGRDLRKNFLKIAPRMGVLVERPAFYDHLSARDNLLLLARLSNCRRPVDKALDRVDLLWAGRKKVGAFSQGMRQRLGLAQALLHEPELLILDEPTNGLDAESAKSTIEYLRFLADTAHVTIVVSSNNLHEAEDLCHRVAVINKGRLIAMEQTEKLLSYDNKMFEALVDYPEAVAKRLLEQDWVESVEIRHGHVHVTLGDATAHQLMSFLVGSGQTVSGIIPKRYSLRDFFLKVLRK